MSASEAVRAVPRSSGIYGTILVLAVIAAFSKGGHPDAGVVLGGVLVTTFVFWIVHVYADTLAARVEAPTQGWRSIARERGEEEWPIVESAGPPAVPLVLGVLGILGDSTAIWLAVGLGLVNLFAWGLLLGRALGYGSGRALVVASINLALGGLMVGLKVLVH